MFNFQKHRVIMSQILKDIYTNSQLSSLLGFKGGTAALFFYNLPRYSVDLDFDLLDVSQKNKVFTQVFTILKKYGQVKKEYIKRNTLFFLLSYGEKEQNIKIEISLRNLNNRFKVLNFFGISIQVMTKADMFANKLVALCDRNKIASRDIFDLYFFFSQRWHINEKIIKHWTKKDLKLYIKDCLLILDKTPNKVLMQGLGELVDAKQKTGVKQKLLAELILEIKLYLSTI
jgi:predicted nucleotidyltransferase component of viral defense system